MVCQRDTGFKSPWVFNHTSQSLIGFHFNVLYFIQGNVFRSFFLYSSIYRYVSSFVSFISFFTSFFDLIISIFTFSFLPSLFAPLFLPHFLQYTYIHLMFSLLCYLCSFPFFLAYTIISFKSTILSDKVTNILIIGGISICVKVCSEAYTFTKSPETSSVLLCDR